jgi:hypothetical protein
MVPSIWMGNKRMYPSPLVRHISDIGQSMQSWKRRTPDHVNLTCCGPRPDFFGQHKSKTSLRDDVRHAFRNQKGEYLIPISTDYKQQSRMRLTGIKGIGSSFSTKILKPLTISPVKVVIHVGGTRLTNSLTSSRQRSEVGAWRTWRRPI